MNAREQSFTLKLVNVGNASLEVAGKLPTIGAVIEFGENLELEAVVVDFVQPGRRAAIGILQNPEEIQQPPILTSVQSVIDHRPRTVTV